MPCCPSFATHSRDPGQLVELEASHVMTQYAPTVKGTHCTAVSSGASQSVVVVQVRVQA